jgi:hypothetical protein
VLASLVSENTSHVLQATQVVQVGQTVSEPLQLVPSVRVSGNNWGTIYMSEHIFLGYITCIPPTLPYDIPLAVPRDIPSNIRHRAQ